MLSNSVFVREICNSEVCACMSTIFLTSLMYEKSLSFLINRVYDNQSLFVCKQFDIYVKHYIFVKCISG